MKIEHRSASSQKSTMPSPVLVNTLLMISEPFVHILQRVYLNFCFMIGFSLISKQKTFHLIWSSLWNFYHFFVSSRYFFYIFQIIIFHSFLLSWATINKKKNVALLQMPLESYLLGLDLFFAGQTHQVNSIR
jgi:hypothetical protein